MIDRIRFIWQLLVLASLLALMGMLLLPQLHMEISTAVFLITLASVTLVNLLTFLVMHAGIQRKD